MKLVLAIVNDDDGQKVIDELGKNGFGVTKLCSTGGFLRSGNTTLLIGVDEEKVDDVVEIIKNKCRSRKQVISSPMPPNGMGGVFLPYPVEVVVGGATIFILNVDTFMKI